jgi:hypothetical protein
MQSWPLRLTRIFAAVVQARGRLVERGAGTAIEAEALGELVGAERDAGLGEGPEDRFGSHGWRGVLL